jgi:hypothetical protein
MMKVTHRGLAKPDDPIYKRGWTMYVGPLQIPKKLSETPSEKAPQKSFGLPGKDITLDALKRRNMPVTRENYILMNWMGDYDPSEPLPAELEAELPDFLQLDAEEPEPPKK